MNSKTIAVILIALGIVVLAYSGITTRPRGNPSISSECTSRPPTATSSPRSPVRSRWPADSCCLSPVPKTPESGS